MRPARSRTAASSSTRRIRAAAMFPPCGLVPSIPEMLRGAPDQASATCLLLPRRASRPCPGQFFRLLLAILLRGQILGGELLHLGYLPVLRFPLELLYSLLLLVGR